MSAGVLGGAIRVSTPFLFVSLGECLTEKSGPRQPGARRDAGDGRDGGLRRLVPDRVALAGRAGARACAGVVLGALHAWLCARPRVNDVAVGIALMLFGIGLAFFLGKPLIEPTAPHLPAIVARLVERLAAGAVGAAGERAVPDRPRAGGRGAASLLRRTRWGLMLRTVGESADAARAMGYDVNARAPAGDDGGRLPGRRRRLVPVAVLSRAAGTRGSRAARG